MGNSIIYFEDNAALANEIINSPELEEYQVLHYRSLPLGGVDELSSLLSETPFMILLDMQPQDDNGFALCHEFCQHPFFSNTPVVFTCDSMSDDDLLRAYEVGAFNFLLKPIQLKVLAAKCKTYQKHTCNTIQLKTQLSDSESVAFDAMMTSSTLGEILRFHESIADVNEMEVLADALLKQVCGFGVTVSLVIDAGDGEPIYCRDEGEPFELEKQVFKTLKNQGRIYSWGHRTVFNYDDFSVLIRTMPIDDEMRYGNIKDQVCLLLNGVESRVKGIVNETRLRASESSIRLIGNTLGTMVVEIQDSNLLFSERFEKIIRELEVDVNEEFANLTLLQSEEKQINSHIIEATSQASELFEQARLKEQAYSKVMIELLEHLHDK
jgi:DNA-binding response OmpR family regulator